MTINARKIAVAALSTVALVAVVAPAQAHAAAYVKRCAWWNLKGGDSLVIDSLANTTSCKAAKQLGDAYLNVDDWYPTKLRAAGKTWRRVYKEEYDSSVEGCGGRNGLTFGSYKATYWEARTRHAWYSVDLVYQIDDGC
jgi:hypothetical protein